MSYSTDLLVPVKLPFFVFVATIFGPYLSIFQTDAPMIPFMFTELENIYSKLLRLLLRQSCLEKTTFIVNRLKKDWIENKENHLENGLVDLGTAGAATKLKLQKTNVRSESRRKFQGECKQFAIDVFLKISERSPMQFSIVQNAQSLDPILIVKFPKLSSQRFTKLADRLFA